MAVISGSRYPAPMPSSSRPPEQHVEGGRLLGEDERVPLREDDDPGGEQHPLGGGGQEPQVHQRIEDRILGLHRRRRHPRVRHHHVLARPDRVEAELLGEPRRGAMRVARSVGRAGVDAEHAELHAATDRQRHACRIATGHGGNGRPGAGTRGARAPEPDSAAGRVRRRLRVTRPGPGRVVPRFSRARGGAPAVSPGFARNERDGSVTVEAEGRRRPSPPWRRGAGSGRPAPRSPRSRSPTSTRWAAPCSTRADRRVLRARRTSR